MLTSQAPLLKRRKVQRLNLNLTITHLYINSINIFRLSYWLLRPTISIVHSKFTPPGICNTTKPTTVATADNSHKQWNTPKESHHRGATKASPKAQRITYRLVIALAPSSLKTSWPEPQDCRNQMKSSERWMWEPTSWTRQALGSNASFDHLTIHPQS
jgi:hypothetical protein